MNEIVTGVAVAAIVGAVALVVRALCRALDRWRVYGWLKNNTRDEPGESHVTTTELAKGTGLSEERVRQACLGNRRIHRASGEMDQWSVWRREPQSVYEKRGIIWL